MENKLKIKDFKDAFNKAYISQMNEGYTKKTIEAYGLEYDCMTLLLETENYYVVRYYDCRVTDTINVVYKDEREMECIEI